MTSLPKESHRVIGIDPGLASTGIGIIEAVSHGWRLVDARTAKTSPSDPLPERLKALHDFVAGAVREHRPNAAALESLFLGRNVRSTVLMAHGRAAALLALADAGIACAEYSPLEIKQSVIGKGRGDKSQVSQMVRAILGIRERAMTEHETDALACAVAHVLRIQIEPAVAEAMGRAGREADPSVEKSLLAEAMRRRGGRRRR